MMNNVDEKLVPPVKQINEKYLWKRQKWHWKYYKFHFYRVKIKKNEKNPTRFYYNLDLAWNSKYY